MKYIDISWPITNKMTTYKDRNDVAVTPDTLACGLHTGTHVDAPAHFIEGGKTIDQLTVDKFCGQCRILDLSFVKEKITVADLQQFAIQPGEIILLKTQNSDLPATGPFEYAFVYLDASGAQFLADKNVKAVGIDYLGIERDQPNHPTHKILLEQEILIFEGLRFATKELLEFDFVSGVGSKTGFLYCFPISVLGVDGSLARAVLLIDE